MTYKNPKALLDAATALPAAIETKLPAGAPKISTKLLDFDSKLPTFPDFPMDLPDLPVVPTLPTLPGGAALGRRYVTAAEVREAPGQPKNHASPNPVGKVSQQIIEKRGF